MKNMKKLLSFCLSCVLLCAALPFAAAAPPQVAPMLSISKEVVLALRNDSTVWAWGKNYEGAFGNGESPDYVPSRWQPEKNLAPEGIKAVAAGNSHGAALHSDGTVWAWGFRPLLGDLGGYTIEALEQMIGNGTLARSAPVPQQVPGLAQVKALHAGNDYTLALKEDGTVWGWGRNAKGELGDGTQEWRLAPVQVAGLDGVIALDTQTALKSDGTVWVWDYYTGYGLRQLTGLTGITAIARSPATVLALRNDGTVWLWDIATYKTGVGHIDPADWPAPQKIAGLENIVGIDASEGPAPPHYIVLKSDGTVWGWGDNFHGELGTGEKQSEYAAPVQARDIFDVAAIYAGHDSSYAIRSDGVVFVWGLDFSHYVNAADLPEPVPPEKGNDAAESFSLGENPFSQPSAYTVRFRDDFGTGAPGPQMKQKGVPLRLSQTTPTRKDYAFLGWSKNKNAAQPDYLAGGEYTDDAPALFYAVWQPNALRLAKREYTVPYGGTVQIEVLSGVAPYRILSSNPGKLSVDYSTGLVTSHKSFNKRESAIITVNDSRGGVSYVTCTVKVEPTAVQWFLIVVCFGWIWM